MVHTLPFYTQWELDEEDGAHILRPAVSDAADGIDLGAPLMFRVPDDLIMYFVVEWTHASDKDIMHPDLNMLQNLPEHLSLRNTSNHYLTAFSRKRNTCVRMPLPNLYTDAHLCTGSSFDVPGFNDPLKHLGIVDSVQTYFNAWANTSWNRDLLGGEDSDLSAQYHKFIRFSAASGEPMPYLGCADWGLGTSPVPLEELYAPWIRQAANKN
jgi:hypothetical protein